MSLTLKIHRTTNISFFDVLFINCYGFFVHFVNLCILSSQTYQKCSLDWAMKWLPASFRESSKDWFAKVNNVFIKFIDTIFYAC